MTVAEVAAVSALVDAFGDAMQQMDWPRCRRLWAEMVANHPWLLDGHEEWTMLDTALRLNELTARQTRSVH